MPSDWPGSLAMWARNQITVQVSKYQALEQRHVAKIKRAPCRIVSDQSGIWAQLLISRAFLQGNLDRHILHRLYAVLHSTILYVQQFDCNSKTSAF
jgi:hypothetical protein